MASQSDASGKVYVVNFADNTVAIYDAAGTVSHTIAAGLYGPDSVAVDPAGKIYVANSVTDRNI